MRKVARASEARMQVLKIAQRMADQRSVIRRALSASRAGGYRAKTPAPPCACQHRLASTSAQFSLSYRNCLHESCRRRRSLQDQQASCSGKSWRRQ
jgi:hypothetical protein